MLARPRTGCGFIDDPNWIALTAGEMELQLVFPEEGDLDADALCLPQYARGRGEIELIADQGCRPGMH